eukprot:RCo026394
MLFCPCCGNLLLVESTEHLLRFFCQTCPYVCPVKETVSERMVLKRKKVDDVMGGEDSWKDADRTKASCPRRDCTSTEAYFRQMQTRSADEPMTEFYKCVLCGEQWKEN